MNSSSKILNVPQERFPVLGRYFKGVVLRPRNSMGSRPVSESLKLKKANSRRSLERQASADSEGLLEEATPSGRPPRPEDLGNTRGKRLAMKFVNKIASKDKYTQVGWGLTKQYGAKCRFATAHCCFSTRSLWKQKWKVACTPGQMASDQKRVCLAAIHFA